METQLQFSVSEFYYGFRKYSIFIFAICLLSCLPEMVFGQKKEKEKKDKQQFNKVTICHNGETLEISESALQAHLNHGDSYGPCEDAVEYTGVITPYIPQVGRVEEKIGADLTSLYEIYERTNNAASNEIFMVENGSKVLINIYAVNGKTNDVESFLIDQYGINKFTDYSASRAYGLNLNLTTVLFPIDKLPDLNLQADIIQFVDPVFTPITNVGVITSQGDVAQKSNMARKAFEVYGSGIKIGALSDGFNALGLNAASADVKNGDLPGTGNPNYSTPVIILEDYPEELRSLYSSFDEGRAMLQIIHDVAPGAELYFHTGVKSAQMMTEGIFELTDSVKCQIIVDDITHYREPFYRDGSIAQTVDIVAGKGVNYFTSAGNFGTNSYEAVFTSASGYESNHDFNAGGGQNNVDHKQEISFGEGFVRIVLQWDDNYQSLDPQNGAQVDLDIFLITDDDDTLVNNNSNNIGKDPFEMMTFNVDEGFANSNIVIHRAFGDVDVKFKYIVFESNHFQLNELSAGSSTITGHANAQGAITVGAVLYSNSEPFGKTPTIASFSSRGGIVMNGESNPRAKPNIAAPNGVNTTVNFGAIYNDDGTIFNIDGDNFPNFFGTSASAPHAAGAAALVLSAYDKFGVSGGDVRNLLESTAIDMGVPGYDLESGAGFIKVDSALMTFANPIPMLTALNVPEGVTPGLEAFEVEIEGKYLTQNSYLLFNGDTIENNNYVNSSKITATIPEFLVEDDPPLYVVNFSVTPTGNDGGISNPLHFIRGPKKIVTVQTDYQTKKYGEKLPEFTATIMIDSIPISDLGITADSLGLDSLTFDPSFTSTSNVGNHIVRIDDITSEIDSALLEYYDYIFKDTVLLIEPLPIEIIPNDLSTTYGDKIEGITYRYNFDSTNFETGNIASFLDSLKQDYETTFPGEDSIGIINRSRFLVNRSRFLVNGSSWTATDLALKNRSRFLVNGNVVIDIDTTLLFDYQNNPDGTIADRSRFLVNGQSLADGEARYVLPDRSRFLVNDGALVNSDGSSDGFDDIVVIADVEDSVVNIIYSINLISGLEVTWGADSLHYIVPGAFLSPKSQNFIISYGIGNLEILPAALNVVVEDKNINLGDSLPSFTSTFTGYAYNENDSSVFSSITYEPLAYDQTGEFEINPILEFRDLINYNLNVTPGTLTIDFAANGRIAIAPFNTNGDTDLMIVNSDGTNPITIVEGPDFVRDPDFSPDGAEIVFAYSDNINGINSNIWKVKSDGSTPAVQLTTDNESSQPIFSPDGAQIAFTSGAQIMIMEADGTSLVQATNTPKNKYSLVYSPDGDAIYFTQLQDLGGYNSVYRLTISSSEIDSIISEDTYFRDLDIYPDGSKILYARASDSGSSGNAVMSMNLDGTGATIIHEGLTIRNPVYSPDGKKIAFTQDGTGISLFTMDTLGRDVKQIFTLENNVLSPSWGSSPDIPIVSIPDPNFEQALIDLGIDSDNIINQQILLSDAEAVTNLNLTDPPNNIYLPNVTEKISNLRGIEGFVNLRFLSCRLNLLDSLDITRNTELTHLRADGNNLTNLDVSNNTKLDTLWAQFNNLNTLDLSHNPYLSVLYLQNNDITSIDLSHNPNLKLLKIEVNPNLAFLDVSHNSLLESLNFHSCYLDSIDLSQNLALTALHCYWNELTVLDLSNNSKLTNLKCHYNQLSFLDVSNGNNSNLTIFEANANELSCISVDDEDSIPASWIVDEGVLFSNSCPNISANLWMLSNSDPDYLIAYDNADNLVLEDSIVDITITITGNEYLKVSELGDYAWIVENTDHSLSKITSTGTKIPAPDQTFDYGRMSLTSNDELYVLEYTGDEFGNNVYLLDQNGTILRSEPYGGTSIVVDEANSFIWIAGAELNKYDMNLEQLSLTSNPITGAAFSMDLDNSGNLWIAEHIDGGDDRLLYISSTGELLNFQTLTNDVASVKVNKVDGKVWYITGGGLTYFDPINSNTVFVGTHYWSFDIDYYNNAIWASGLGEIYKYSFEGEFLDRITNSNVAGYNIIGTRSYFGSILADPIANSSSSNESSIIQGEMTIYPNPVINVITLTHEDNSIEVSDLGVVVYDNYGSVYPISTIFINVTDGFELDLSELVVGNYILHISDGKTIEIFRIQKE